MAASLGLSLVNNPVARRDDEVGGGTTEDQLVVLPPQLQHAGALLSTPAGKLSMLCSRIMTGRPASVREGIETGAGGPVPRFGAFAATLGRSALRLGFSDSSWTNHCVTCTSYEVLRTLTTP